MSGEHAIFAPSAAARWVACAGSVKLESTVPALVTPEHDQAAAEGNAAHYFAAEMLRIRVGAGLPRIPGKAPNGIVADDEMLEAATMYVDDVRETTQGVMKLHIEERIGISTVHPDNWGTCDLWAFKQAEHGDGGVLLLWDFKYGHRFVDAFVNWQLIDYAAGILDTLEKAQYDRSSIVVIFTVVQPRNYHPASPIRRWSVKAPELDGYIDDLRSAAADAMKESPLCRVNPECRDCKARHQCGTLHAAADNAADIATYAVAMQLPATALGVELRMLRRNRALMDARLSGLEAEAEARLRAGERIPHFHLAPNASKEIWAMDTATVLTLGESIGVPLAKEPAPVTPNQARKLLKAAGIGEEILTGFSERPPGAMKVTELDDSKAARIFGK